MELNLTNDQRINFVILPEDFPEGAVKDVALKKASDKQPEPDKDQTQLFKPGSIFDGSGV